MKTNNKIKYSKQNEGCWVIHVKEASETRWHRIGPWFRTMRGARFHAVNRAETYPATLME